MSVRRRLNLDYQPTYENRAHYHELVHEAVHPRDMDCVLSRYRVMLQWGLSFRGIAIRSGILLDSLAHAGSRHMSR